ncbi:MAG: extracellular solute-binding protein, partial [Chloroflexi bacterium]|nr:extracellular solute-binding protein [Chloroflexota bacterium]
MASSHRNIDVRRRFSPHLLAACSVVLLSACGGAPALSAPVPSTELSRVTITFWHAETGPAASLLDSLTSEFHDQYPAIKVTGEAKKDEGDLLRQGIAGMAMNELPDLAIASKRTIGEFARKGAVVPLDAFFDDPSIGLSAADRGDFV